MFFILHLVGGVVIVIILFYEESDILIFSWVYFKIILILVHIRVLFVYFLEYLEFIRVRRPW